ncbi:MAG: glycosyltransferase, partial [Patescibacteria group bacterium]
TSAEFVIITTKHATEKGEMPTFFSSIFLEKFLQKEKGSTVLLGTFDWANSEEGGKLIQPHDIVVVEVKNKDNFHLVLGGDGSEEKFVHKMIHDLHLEPYVELPGWMTKEDLYNRFKQADIYVQAHWRKDLTAMSLMTAMMFGLPSIIPGGGGLEWVARGSALYFKDNDSDDLARKIEQLVDDYQLREKLSKQCYIRMDEPELNHRSRIAELDQRMKEAVANAKKDI